MFRIRSAQMSMCNVTDGSVRIRAFFLQMKLSFTPLIQFLERSARCVDDISVSLCLCCIIIIFLIKLNKQQLTPLIQTA